MRQAGGSLNSHYPRHDHVAASCCAGAAPGCRGGRRGPSGRNAAVRPDGRHASAERPCSRARSSCRPALVAAVLVTLGGMPNWWRGLASRFLIVSIVPLPAYRDTLVRLGQGRHRLRSTRDCVLRYGRVPSSRPQVPRALRRRGGRRLRDAVQPRIFVLLPSGAAVAAPKHAVSADALSGSVRSRRAAADVDLGLTLSCDHARFPERPDARCRPTPCLRRGIGPAARSLRGVRSRGH